MKGRISMNENIIINEELLAENADFLKTVVGAKTIEDARKICVEYNVELPEDVWQEIQNACCEGELGENDLDTVSGGKVSGSHLLSALGGVVGLGATIAAGSAGGVLVACAWIGYNAYKAFR